MYKKFSVLIHLFIIFWYFSKLNFPMVFYQASGNFPNVQFPKQPLSPLTHPNRSARLSIYLSIYLSSIYSIQISIYLAMYQDIYEFQS